MEIEFTKNKIKFDKILNSLDELAIDFSKILKKQGIKHVFISGYVAILFGRSRSSEDIDLFVEKIDYDKFKELWSSLTKKFECLNTSNPEEAYREYLLKNTAIRFARKGYYIPNVEVKFPNKETDFLSLKNSIEVTINKDVIWISPIELQIPFKLFLGSGKDIEDARHLYKLFRDKLRDSVMKDFARKLNIEEEFTKYLK